MIYAILILGSFILGVGCTVLLNIWLTHTYGYNSGVIDILDKIKDRGNDIPSHGFKIKVEADEELVDTLQRVYEGEDLGTRSIMAAQCATIVAVYVLGVTQVVYWVSPSPHHLWRLQEMLGYVGNRVLRGAMPKITLDRNANCLHFGGMTIVWRAPGKAIKPESLALVMREGILSEEAGNE